jgi:hypothetical protein
VHFRGRPPGCGPLDHTIARATSSGAPTRPSGTFATIGGGRSPPVALRSERGREARHAASDDATYAAEQRGWVLHARRLAQGILTRRGCPRAAATARHLLALLMGVAVQAVFDAEDWPRARQVAFFREEIRRIDALR